MNPLIAIITFPFRYVADAVDARPSVATVKEHLQRQEVVFTETDQGIIAGLRRKGTPVCSEHLVAAQIADAPEIRQAYKVGVQAGVALVTHEVSDLTRSKINDQKKAAAELQNLRQALNAAGVTDEQIKQSKMGLLILPP